MNTFRNSMLLAMLVAVVLAGSAGAQSRRDRFKQLQARAQQSEQQSAQNGGGQNRRRGRNQQKRNTQAGGNNQLILKGDLIVERVYQAGDALGVTIRNGGGVRTPDTNMQIQIKRRTDGRVLETKNARVGALEPGARASIRRHGMNLNNVLVVVTVDPQNRVGESNEGNNTGQMTVAARPGGPPAPRPLPDLFVSELRRQGNVLILTVANKGTAASRATTTHIRIASRVGKPDVIKTGNVRALKPGERAQTKFHNVVLDNVVVTVGIDPRRQIKESNKGNNGKQLVVGDQTTRAPDLTIGEFRFFPEKQEVWVQVRNVGAAGMSGSTHLRLVSYFGPGNVKEQKLQRVSGIGRGQHIFYRIRMEQIQRGMQFEAIVDPQNDFPEQNERNNRKVQTF
ncbi:MAG: CARDB domain-containing protein [Planctomycetota bacterium]